MSGYEAVPQIGRRLAAALERIGVCDLGTLRASGALATWERLRAQGLADDAPSLLDLEAAIEGVRWHRLPAEVRKRLTDHVSALHPDY